jgi:serine/threonine protein kinase/Tol biopolymer transport system component
MPLSLHQFVDHYEILASIGSGGMGEVYRARDTRLNRDVAIKVLSSVSTVDAERLRRFEQEARAAASLNHPNILAIYQLGSYFGAPYLVSELLEGETLRDRLRRGPLPVRKVIDYGKQIAKGLAAAHEKGIIHRDLKPENLFLTKDGHVKILDFGLARLTQVKESDLAQSTPEAQTMAGMVLGTVGYMSPEQVRGLPADQRSDIFSFTVVLYEMLTGQRAFQKSTSIETMGAILNEEPPALAELAPKAPPGLQKVLHRGLEKNPEQRFQSASDLAFALEALSDTDYSTFTSSYKSEPKPPARSRRPVVITTVAVLVIAAILAFFWLRPVAEPQVTNYVQLSHDGLPKALVGTDGSRIFLNVDDSGGEGVEALPVTGGEEARVAMPEEDMVPVDVSPDGSNFLVVEGTGFPATGPLWTVPVMGGSPQRLADAAGHVAAWSDDGKQLVYGNGTDVYLARADGSNARKLATMQYIVSGVSISPERKNLQVETEEISQSGTSVVAGERSIWDVPVSGAKPRPLITDWKNTRNECCGRWTEDGKFFVFQSQGQIWALPRAGRMFHRRPEPIQLTSSPMQLQSPLPSRDGKKLFVVGMTFRGQLTEFDVRTGKPSLFLGGISADWVETSRDGKQVAYVSYPQGDLWRSNIDGTNRVKLTFGPVKPVLPRWSPDGQSILFFDFPGGPNHPGKMYVIPATGGTARELLPNDAHNAQDPTWSADGNKIVFSGDANDASTSSDPAIKILDVQSGNVSPVPGSQGMFSPRWSPDGRYIAGMTSDSKNLLLFDVRTQKWKKIAEGTFSWINWSRDSQYIYSKDQTATDAVVRVRIKDGKIERLVSLKDYVLTGLGGGAVSVAPDGSPLLLLDRGTQDVYALDWIAP